jgi:PAS domain S-box-containing protein
MELGPEGRELMKKILVVDNNPVMLHFMTNLLEKHGHQVLTAKDGLSALGVLKTYVPEIMFVDLVMPNISGEKLCQIIRSIPECKDVFIVIVSAIAREQKVDPTGLGANACIAKGPFNRFGKHVLYVLDQLESETPCDLSKETIGLEDIHERQITKELLSSKKHSEVILGNISEGILELTRQARVVYANTTATALFGLTQAELLASEFSELFPLEEDRRRLNNLLKEIGDDPGTVNQERPLSLNGKQLTLQVSPITDEGEQSLVVILNDITERMLADKALRESEKKYRNILESINEGYYEVDISGRLTFFNRVLCEILGYPGSELVGKNLLELAGHKNSMKEYLIFNNALTDVVDVKNVEWVIIGKDGNERNVEASISPIRDREGEGIGYRGLIRDVTERKLAERTRQRLEAQLRLSQKLESLGTLAGGIAHNFNNLLMAIQGYASLMLYDMDPSHRYYSYLLSIEKQVESGSKLASQLLGYAREGKYKIKPFSLNQVVKESSETFGAAKKEIRIHRDLCENLMGIEADQGQIEQALMNLYINAADAMPRGGDLFLKTMNLTHEDMNNKPYEAKPGNYVLLKIRDTGLGMENETKARVFEPFFTTKEMGRGTGLGLASTYGIIKGHGGYIDVNSEKGHGTTFSIYLPVSEGQIQAEEKISRPLNKGTETILLVDDEELVLQVGLDMLKELGYRTLASSGGKEAIKIYEEHQDDIDMVILDMIIPDMAGGEVFDRLRQINNRVKVLLSSGYSVDGQANEIIKRGCNGFIQKPFRMADLSRKIAEILR